MVQSHTRTLLHTLDIGQSSEVLVGDHSNSLSHLQCEVSHFDWRRWFDHKEYRKYSIFGSSASLMSLSYTMSDARGIPNLLSFLSFTPFRLPLHSNCYDVYHSHYQHRDLLCHKARRWATSNSCWIWTAWTCRMQRSVILVLSVSRGWYSVYVSLRPFHLSLFCTARSDLMETAGVASLFHSTSPHAPRKTLASTVIH